MKKSYWIILLTIFFIFSFMLQTVTFASEEIATGVAEEEYLEEDVFEEEQTLTGLSPKIDRLAEHLDRIACLEHVGDTRQRGMIGAVELVRDRQTKEPFPWKEKRGIRVCDHARREGVLLRPLGNVIVIMPPLSVTLDELDRICEAVYNGIEATS